MMTLITDTNRRQQIVSRIQDVLDRHQPRAYRVSVQADGIFEEDDWIQVLVVSPNDQRDRDFYDALSESETELSESNDGKNYLLVPVIADN